MGNTTKDAASTRNDEERLESIEDRLGRIENTLLLMSSSLNTLTIGISSADSNCKRILEKLEK